ncbi:MAG: mechanosensitive ion channel family protein, partial [Candidatus Aminicenantes bacterium]|nr:mechanosensitive ion channel family protein [Candidatus Aminicenantes bacterium]
MNTTLSPETAFYFELLIALAAAGLTVGLVWFLRRAVRAASGERETAAGFVLARLVLPVALLAVTSLLRLEAVRNVLPLRPRDLDFIYAAFIFFVVFFIIRLFDALFRARYIRRGRPVPMPRVLHGFILAVIYLVCFFFILQRNLGVNIGPFLTTSAILTAVLGLALQGVLSNILAGLSLNSTRAFGRGDWVKVGDVEGIVVETNWRETRLLDRASNIVVIPNSAVAGSLITNFGLPDARTAITIPVKASFQAPPPRVLELLKEAARETPTVAADPPPTAYL